MRRDVRMLGEVLGDVIRESGGQDLLDDVERLRRSVIAARQPSAVAGAVEEIAPGVFHWKARHPRIKAEVSSYYLAEPRTLLDPMVPTDVGLAWFDERRPERIVLTNRHHYRESDRFRERWDVAIAKSIAVSDVLALQAVERKRAAWAKCADLAQAPRILAATAALALD